MADSHFIAGTEEQTAALAESLAVGARAGDVVLLAGPLGAGKTVFARAFIRALAGAPALEIPSPTFTLVQSYEAGALQIWHFDLWRLRGGHEVGEDETYHALEELGWEEARSGICLVEWPDRLGALAPSDALRITITRLPHGRGITVSGPARWFHAS